MRQDLVEAPSTIEPALCSIVPQAESRAAYPEIRKLHWRSGYQRRLGSP
jgi:hypothetical protein